MDAAVTALADLTEISKQVEQAVVFAGDGTVLASTQADEEASSRLARTALELFRVAGEAAYGSGRTLSQLELSLRDRSLFVAREGGRGIVATAAAGVPSGLVLYDLGVCLRAIPEPEQGHPEPEAPRKRAPARKRTPAKPRRSKADA